MNSQAAVWYEEGISKLVSRYDKCLNVQGDYVEKYVKVCDKTCISVSLLLSINIFVWQNVLYFLDVPLNNISKSDKYFFNKSCLTVPHVIRLAHTCPDNDFLCHKLKTS